MKDAFVRLIRAAEKAKHMDSEMSKTGYENNLYADIFGDIADAIYDMLGENTNTFENSLTYSILNTDAITIDGRASLLADLFMKSNPAC